MASPAPEPVAEPVAQQPAAAAIPMPQAAEADTGTGQLISPYDQRVYDIPKSQHELYLAKGWFAPSAGSDDSEIHKSISNWHEQGIGEAAFYSGTAGFLLAPTALAAAAHYTGHDDWAKAYADNVQMAHEQHPTVSAVSELGGNVASTVAYSTAALAAAPGILAATGIGAGAAAAGVGAAEAAGVVAAGGEALSLGQKAVQLAPTVARLGARLAGEGAAIGLVSRYDQAAIQHAASPEGQEKIVWAFGDIARDAAIGGVGGLAFVGGLKGLTMLGKKVGLFSTEKLTDALLNKVTAEQVANQGREGELRTLVKEIIPMGIERGRVHVDNIIDKAEKDMNQLKYQIEGKGNFLDNSTVQKLKAQVDDLLGGTVEGKNLLIKIEELSGETERAATHAPGNAARVGDKAAVDANRAAIRQHAADKAAWEAQTAAQRRETGAYEKWRNETSGEQSRLNEKAEATYQDQLKIYNSQQEAFNTASGNRMSVGEYQAKFGRDVPANYHEAPPVRPSNKTARVAMEEPPAQYPVKAPDPIEMRPDAHYESLNENYFAANRRGDPDKVLNPQALQELRRYSYDMIRYENFGREYKGVNVDEKLRDAGHVIGDHIKDIFEKADSSLGKEYASDWAMKDAQYSAAQLAKTALRKGTDTLGFGGFVDKLVSSAAIAGAAGTMGFMGGPLSAAGASAGFKAIQSFKPEHFFYAARAFGNVLGNAEKLMAGTIISNLRNVPVALTNYYTPAKYKEMAAQIAVIASDPAAAAANKHAAYTNAGIPEDIATNVVGQQMGQHTYLADQMKQVTGPADMPSQGHGDPVKMRKVAGQAEVMRNPAHGLAYPTEANLEVLKKFYPNTLMTAQAAVYVQLRKNAKLSPKAKQWASRLLGRPINNLSSPGFSAMLQQSRAATQQAAQQTKGPSGGSRSASQGEDTGSQTRLDELQGGG